MQFNNQLLIYTSHILSEVLSSQYGLVASILGGVGIEPFLSQKGLLVINGTVSTIFYVLF